MWAENKLPIIVDPDKEIIDTLRPDILIDAIMAKRNWGTRLTDVSLVIGLGPDFRTGVDVHLVVETNNNENLGKVILSNFAVAD